MPDLADVRDVRWPGFAADAVAAGVAAVFAFPLQIAAIRLGVLDLCRDRRGGLTGRNLTAALLVADMATLTLLAITEGSPEDALDEACQGSSLLHRSEIHQAQPIDEADVRKALAHLIGAYTAQHYRLPSKAAVRDVWLMLTGLPHAELSTVQLKARYPCRTPLEK